MTDTIEYKILCSLDEFAEKNGLNDLVKAHWGVYDSYEESYDLEDDEVITGISIDCDTMRSAVIPIELLDEKLLALVKEHPHYLYKEKYASYDE